MSDCGRSVERFHGDLNISSQIMAFMLERALLLHASVAPSRKNSQASSIKTLIRYFDSSYFKQFTLIYLSFG